MAGRALFYVAADDSVDTSDLVFERVRAIGSMRTRRLAAAARGEHERDDDEAPPGVVVGSIVPNSMPRNTTGPVTITGSGFQSGATVTFENGSGRAPAAANIIVVNDTTINATVSVHRKAKLSAWDVRVTNPDNSTGVLAEGFTVVP